MFEHRLGLALGKDLMEIRAMPIDEFRSWQLFYQLEPWGWHEEEYRLAISLAQDWNLHMDTKSKMRKVSDYVRDMLELTKKSIYQKKREAEMKEKMKTASVEEKKRMIARSMGINIKDGK